MSDSRSVELEKNEILRVVIAMENEVLITGIFVGAGLLAYVIVPGLLVMWDRVLDHMNQW